jgi:hypothetical protein
VITSGSTYTVLFWHEGDSQFPEDESIRQLAESIRSTIQRDGVPTQFLVVDREVGGDRFWRAWTRMTSSPKPRGKFFEGGGV